MILKHIVKSFLQNNVKNSLRKRTKQTILYHTIFLFIWFLTGRLKYVSKLIFLNVYILLVKLFLIDYNYLCTLQNHILLCLFLMLLLGEWSRYVPYVPWRGCDVFKAMWTRGSSQTLPRPCSNTCASSVTNRTSSYIQTYSQVSNLINPFLLFCFQTFYIFILKV